MKTLISILFVLLVVGCRNPEKTEELVVGTYKSDSMKIVLKEGNVCESYSISGKIEQFKGIGTWEIINGEVVLTNSFETKVVTLNLGKQMEFCRIETNGDLIVIESGMNKDGVVKRTDDQPKEFTTYAKLK